MIDILDSNIKTIFFDLDGTLLDLNMDTFLPRLLKAFTKKISHLVPNRLFIKYMINSMKLMNNNNGPETNEVLFNNYFYPKMPCLRSKLEPLINEFFEKDFDDLKIFSRRMTGAKTLIQCLTDLDFDIVIATTPISPISTIHHRLKWAGLDEFHYTMITSCENSRACKPSYNYFKDILKAINQRAEDCLMVGDENKDMLAANFGFKTFLIPGERTKLGQDTPKPDYIGDLVLLYNIIENSHLYNKKECYRRLNYA